MDVYVAADMSDELGEPVTLPETILVSPHRIQAGDFRPGPR